MATKSIIRENSDVFIFVQGRMNHLCIEDIIYVEHNSRTVLMHTVKEVLYIPYVSLGRIHEALGKDYFYQCHKSFLVNKLYIEKIDRTENNIILKNFLGTVAVGRKYKMKLLRDMHYVE